MDEDDAEPVVDVVVHVLAGLGPAVEHHHATSHRLVGRHCRGNLHGQRVVLQEAAELAEEGQHVYQHRATDDVLHGTPRPRFEGVADIDVALNRQRHREPDGGRVEHGGNELRQVLVGQAPLERDVLPEPVRAEEVDEDGHGKDPGEHVGDRHGDEEGVGGAPHVTLEQHDADQRVVDDGEEHEDGREVAVDGDGVVRLCGEGEDQRAHAEDGRWAHGVLLTQLASRKQGDVGVVEVQVHVGGQQQVRRTQR